VVLVGASSPVRTLQRTYMQYLVCFIFVYPRIRLGFLKQFSKIDQILITSAEQK